MYTTDWKPSKQQKDPLYKQIFKHLKEKILSGEWPIGSKIPPERDLALAYGVNRSTVVTALAELKADGLIEGQTGSGTRVVNNTWPLMKSDTPPNWDEYVKTGIYRSNFSTMKQIIQAEQDPRYIHLGISGPPPELYSEKIMANLFEKLPSKITSLWYEESKGLLQLRQQLSEYLNKRKINASPSSILIVSGALQALQLISIGLLKRGSTILVENPSYLQSLPIFQSAGMKLRGVPFDGQGIDITAIENLETTRNISMLYTIPCFHNPTGISMSQKRREGLLKLCENEHLPIVEDDIYRDLWIDEEAPLPLKAFDKTGTVLYLGSMSKSFAPGLRIGWLVGPESVINRLADLKMQIDYGTSTLSQWAVAELLESGLYMQHLDALRKNLTKRREVMLDALHSYMTDLATWNIPSGGFFIWLKFSKPISIEKLFTKAMEQNILLNPGFLYDQNNKTHIRLSYGFAKIDEIEIGIQKLASVIKHGSFLKNCSF